MKKKLPILTANYKTLIEGNGYYVDKTQFIHTIENLSSPNLFFLRPRRFGKSLHLSMLEYYYGVHHKNRFEELFGSYFIGQPENTTKLRNSYHILRFDFSGVTTDEKERVKGSFNAKLSKGFKEFHDSYNGFDRSILASMENHKDPADYLLTVLSEITSNIPDCKIFLLIDEYDHFTNELFAFNTEHFKEIVSRNGWVRKFYEVIKQFMGSGLIDRFFATGVTPVTLDSMTSGFNVASNITLEEKFNEMAGFSEDELRRLIKNTIYEEGSFDLESVVDDMRDWYNGSRFSRKGKNKIYNPQLVIHFLSKLGSEFEYPDEMVDINVTSDYKKIANILRPLEIEEKSSIIEEVLTQDKISEGLTLQYNFERPFTKTDAVSLLFYNGLLTIEESIMDRFNFVIPNYVIKQLYWEFLRSLHEEENNFVFDTLEIKYALEEMSFDGTVSRLINYTQKVMTALSYRDLQNFSEKHFKMIFMTIFGGNIAYFVRSELETPRGYADIYLRKTAQNPGKFNHLIELKYLKNSDKNKLAKIKEEGIVQVTKYRDSLPDEEKTNLKTWLLIFYDKFEYLLIPV